MGCGFLRYLHPPGIADIIPCPASSYIYSCRYPYFLYGCMPLWWRDHRTRPPIIQTRVSCSPTTVYLAVSGRARPSLHPTRRISYDRRAQASTLGVHASPRLIPLRVTGCGVLIPDSPYLLASLPDRHAVWRHVLRAAPCRACASRGPIACLTSVLTPGLARDRALLQAKIRIKEL